MIAYHFPPVGGIGAAGSQRTLKFAKYLPYYGWKPIILTVKPSQYESYLSLDSTLLKRVDPETRIIRTSVIRWLAALLEGKRWLREGLRGRVASPRTEQGYRSEPSLPTGCSKGWYARTKDAFTDLFEIPDEEIGWSIPAIVAGFQALKEDSIDAIFSTGRPWTSHVIGLALKHLTGIPLVVDFRDPWITNPFRRQYSRLRSRAEEYLETKVIKAADRVVANTQELANEFKSRYPNQSSRKFLSLLNGFDPDDFDQVSAEARPRFVFTIVHTGFLYGKRDPKTFLDALRTLVDEARIPRSKIRVMFVGTVEVSYNLSDYVRHLGLEDIVSLLPQVTYQESLMYLKKADATLLLQPGTTTQVPSKLFDYIGAGKPILAISPRDGATYNLVAKEKLGELAEPEAIEQIAGSLERLYRGWMNARGTSSLSPMVQDKFNVRHLTKTLASELQSVFASR